mmetsp:Transcript_9489/g.12744  ORF Transcript_9489/g.12744 Transcript_9489/m.12744 type:complete len:356 (+) Transcript_9489:242-1309(+)
MYFWTMTCKFISTAECVLMTHRSSSSSTFKSSFPLGLCALFWWKFEYCALCRILNILGQLGLDLVQNIINTVDRHMVSENKLVALLCDFLGLSFVGRIGIVAKFLHEILLVGRIVRYPMFSILGWIWHPADSDSLVYHDHGTRQEGFPQTKVTLPTGRVACHDDLGIPQVAQVVRSKTISDAKIFHFANEGRIAIFIRYDILFAIIEYFHFSGFSRHFFRKLVGPFDDPVARFVRTVFAVSQNICNGKLSVLKGNQEIFVALVCEITAVGLLFFSCAKVNLAIHFAFVGTLDNEVHISLGTVQRDHHRLCTGISKRTHLVFRFGTITLKAVPIPTMYIGSLKVRNFGLVCSHLLK